MKFKFDLKQEVVALMDNRIVKGEIIRRKYTEGVQANLSSFNTIVYNVIVCGEDYEKREETFYESDLFAGPDELVKCLLDNFKIDMDNMA